MFFSVFDCTVEKIGFEKVFLKLKNNFQILVTF